MFNASSELIRCYFNKNVNKGSAKSTVLVFALNNKKETVKQYYLSCFFYGRKFKNCASFTDITDTYFVPSVI